MTPLHTIKVCRNRIFDLWVDCWWCNGWQWRATHARRYCPRWFL